MMCLDEMMCFDETDDVAEETDDVAEETALPEMTPLQALTVNILFQGEKSSRYIRDELAFNGVKRQMSLVYRMLGRLELTGA